MNDLVDKATAWDACDASFKKGLAKGRAERLDALEKIIEEMLPYVEYINKAQRGPFYLKMNAERILSKASKFNPNTPERNDE